MLDRLHKLRQHDPGAAQFLEPALLDIMTNAPPTGLTPAIQAAIGNVMESGQAPDVVVIPGAAIPSAIHTVLNQLPATTRVLVLERDAARAANFFREVPIETYLSEGRLTLAFGNSVNRVDERFQSMLDMPNTPLIRVFEWPQSVFVDRAYYRSALLEIRNRMRVRSQNLVTLVRLGPLWQYNIIKNLSFIFKNPGVKRLHHQFKGKPALVVAAGPSLAGLLPRIRPIADRFVILAVGTALRPLRQAGIRPDLVLSVDAHPLTGKQFHLPCDDLFLVASAMAYPPILQKFKGQFTGHVNVDPIAEWIADLQEHKGIIFGGGTVSASAIDLAREMGCNPILSVGLDLCMQEDGRTHSDGTVYQNQRYTQNHLIRVPGNYSETVPTTEQFRVYIDILREYARLNKTTKLININDGGARLEGMERFPSSALESFAGPVCHAYATVQSLHAAFRHPGMEDWIRIRNAMETSIRQMETILADSMEAAMICNQLRLMGRHATPEDEPMLRNGMERLEIIDRGILEARESSRLLDMSLRPAYFKTQRTRDDAAHDPRSVDRVYLRSRALYEQTAGASRWTGALLRRTLEDIPVNPTPRIDDFSNERMAG